MSGTSTRRRIRLTALFVSLSLSPLAGCGVEAQPKERAVPADGRQVALHVAGMTERLNLV